MLNKRVMLCIATLLVLSGAAWAASPHFLRAAASLDAANNVVVAFKEAGLGNNQLIRYVASANAVATYQCVNRGGNCPQAANKTNVSGPVSAEGVFSSGKNGQVTQSLTINPPSPGDFACPSGQVMQTAAVTYSGIKITDATNNVSADATPSNLAVSTKVCP